MAICTKLKRSCRIKIILSGFLFLSLPFHFVFSQPARQQLLSNEFMSELRKALLADDQRSAELLIKDHRLFVKPFVNDLITECIYNEIKGKTKEAYQVQLTAQKAAKIFESIFGEKSLSIGVNYLTVWSKEQKKTKLIADSLYLLGTGFRGKDPGKAEKYHQQALNAYGMIGDERGEAEVLGGLGLIYWGLDPQKCLVYYRDALKMREKVDDRQLIGNTLNSLGSVQVEFFHNYPQAISWYEMAEIIREEIGDMPNLQRTRTYKANAYYKTGSDLNNEGRYYESLEQYEKALQIYREINDAIGFGEALNQMGFVYSRLGDYNTAVEKLTQAVQIMIEENDSLGLAGVYNHFGIVLQMAGRIEKAKEYYLNSLNIYENQEDLSGQLPILSNLGTLFFDLKDNTKAEDYLNRGLQISRELGDKEKETDFLLNLANNQTIIGRLDEAKANYESGLKTLQSTHNPDLKWRLVAGLAENYERRGDYEKAVELNDSALIILEGIRNTIKNEELKVSYMARERFAFEDIINLLAMLHGKDDTKGYDLRAFHYAERCKSRVLLDLLSRSFSGANDAQYSAMKYSAPVSSEEVQSLCKDKNSVILEYSVGDSSSCLWVITGSDFRIFSLPGRKTLQEQVETIRFALLDPELSDKAFFVRAGLSLYERLIKPAESYLSKKSKLVIIPDGVLNYLPFEVLLTETTDVNSDASYSDLPFLVKKYPVSYVQSASVLKSLLSPMTTASNSGSGSKRIIAFGDPAYEEDPAIVAAQGYRRLEYSGEEVKKIASFFKPGSYEIFLNKEATEENVKREGELKKYNYLHFATHGFINEDKPDLSSLVLCQQNRSGEDGLLQAQEIFNLKLNADLVVLSACQTGLGKLVRGEGIVGLTRAFMYAGTPSVLVSLWSVSDISTAILMGEFYKYLIKNKLCRTDALRKAQLSLINDPKFAHPFYWAPFVLIGDWR